jgi:anaerobic C4-dicarboxylate transporter DcuA
MIFIGAKVGGIGLGIYGMVGVFILVFIFGLKPGSIPIDVMLIIVSVITASAALQAAGGLDYMVNKAAWFLRKHPSRITFFAPLVTWLFTHLAGTAHTCYALLPIISEIARKEKVRPERPISVATIAASLGCTGSPVSAATAAILSKELLGDKGIGMTEILMVTIPASVIAILVASLVQNYVGKPMEKDPEYQRRLSDPCGEWLFLPAQLSDRGGCHRLRPHRHYPCWQVCGEPLVPTFRLDYNVCQHRYRLFDNIILILT